MPVIVRHLTEDPRASKTTVRVALSLRETMVTPEFRDFVFERAGVAGQSVTEFILRAAADRILAGRPYVGLFREGDREAGR